MEEIHWKGVVNSSSDKESPDSSICVISDRESESEITYQTTGYSMKNEIDLLFENDSTMLHQSGDDIKEKSEIADSREKVMQWKTTDSRNEQETTGYSMKNEINLFENDSTMLYQSGDDIKGKSEIADNREKVMQWKTTDSRNFIDRGRKCGIGPFIILMLFCALLFIHYTLYAYGVIAIKSEAEILSELRQENKLIRDQLGIAILDIKKEKSELKRMLNEIFNRLERQENTHQTLQKEIHEQKEEINQKIERFVKSKENDLFKDKHKETSELKLMLNEMFNRLERQENTHQTLQKEIHEQKKEINLKIERFIKSKENKTHECSKCKLKSADGYFKEMSILQIILNQLCKLWINIQDCVKGVYYSMLNQLHTLWINIKGLGEGVYYSMLNELHTLWINIKGFGEGVYYSMLNALHTLWNIIQDTGKSTYHGLLYCKDFLLHYFQNYKFWFGLFVIIFYQRIQCHFTCSSCPKCNEQNKNKQD